MGTTGVVKDKRYMGHDPGPSHVESPLRLKAIYDRLEMTGLVDKLVSIPPREATKEELAWNHTINYIERIEATAGKPVSYLDPDTSTSPDSYLAAILAVGGVFNAIDVIMDGKLKNGFALIRPPGHHAERDHAMGFCLFNNVALGAHYLLKEHGVKKVLIMDWDLHHGNGTQHSFYADPKVMYISTHQYPYYPGTGSLDEVGEGEGRGFTVNVPLSAGMEDIDYASVFNRVIAPIGSAFKPDFILVSAGFDTYMADPLGGMKVTEQGFAYQARVLIELAKQVCNGKILFCLEGGYSLKGLADGVCAVLYECLGETILDANTLKFFKHSEQGPDVIDKVLEIQSQFWDIR